MFLHQLDQYTVGDIMDRRLIKLKEEANSREAINTMISHNLDDIILTDETEKVVAVLTFKDLMKQIRSEEDLTKPLKDLVSQKVIVSTEEAQAIEARNLMKKNHIGRLPVIREGKVVGIVRVNDILNKVYSKIDEMHTALEKILDSLYEGVCVVNPEGTVLLWSKGIEKLYEVNQEEIVGRNLEEFFPTALLLKTLNSKQPIRNVYHSPRPGSYAIISSIPIFIGGEMIAAVSTDRDITETTNLSEELETTKEKLDLLETEVKKINEEQYSFHNVIGKSDIIKEKILEARKVALANSSVLIGGESGTGKEVFARAIHQASGRKGPFVAINCSAIPESLFESEMFGYESGAFTGALNKGKIGKVELANQGTLFLDEIGDMPLYMQAKMLRVLQERQVLRVGGEKSIDIDVRVISATHRNLENMVTEGTFREDLYYRLNVVYIDLPSLRERKEDIPIFLRRFISEFCEENNLRVPEIDAEVLQVLMNYPWPGNIRELKNAIEHLVIFSKDNVIQKNSLPERVLEKKITDEKQQQPVSFDLQENIRNTEISTIKGAMDMADNNKAKAAKIMNIPRSTLYYKLKYYGMKEYL
ncbi:Transcriptional regulator containing PAS, AAA-type ATPase, and DNA-binding Fis domains [Tindallia magadiensis]|uniref:Transcriptional regulator containing PAS, AAA-type ATPase, and DNA-binding Fis domains n=1 Tax=Tindallia magadiensis TaxID=69895 RepID=A0A1I3C5W1_9FIRM|nr:sigma-54 dependent transcriptional regulator PrdR [Tindallia magadiensis]SFH69539.1 Transcriptional regulator containing PAS, AAA-type ATPase, and DNA-binding Fis domains [Tindallia magadiensis]